MEGHTDASGTENYNMILSKKRAGAVKNYLIKYYNISANRLLAKGKGETALLNNALPDSAANRRVRIINIGY